MAQVGISATLSVTSAVSVAFAQAPEPWIVIRTVAVPKQSWAKQTVGFRVVPPVIWIRQPGGVVDWLNTAQEIEPMLVPLPLSGPKQVWPLALPHLGLPSLPALGR